MNITCSSTFLPSCSVNFPSGYLVSTTNGGFGQDVSEIINSDNANMILYINEDGRLDVMEVSDSGGVVGSATIDVTAGVISLKEAVITLSYFNASALDSSAISNSSTKIPTSSVVYAALAEKVNKLNPAQEDKILLGASDGGIKSSGKTFVTSVTSTSTNNDIPTAFAVYSALNAVYPTETWDDGDGTKTTWTIPATAHHIEVFINGVKQRPGLDFTTSGTTLTLPTTLSTGSTICIKYYS